MYRAPPAHGSPTCRGAPGALRMQVPTSWCLGHSTATARQLQVRPRRLLRRTSVWCAATCVGQRMSCRPWLVDVVRPDPLGCRVSRGARSRRERKSRRDHPAASRRSPGRNVAPTLSPRHSEGARRNKRRIAATQRDERGGRVVAGSPRFSRATKTRRSRSSSFAAVSPVVFVHTKNRPRVSLAARADGARRHRARRRALARRARAPPRARARRGRARCDAFDADVVPNATVTRRVVKRPDPYATRPLSPTR